MPVRFIDLHIHTTASDGSDTPAQVVEKAARIGLAAVAITDHDTVSGLAEAEEAGRRFGVEVIRGCELSVTSEYGEVHLLALWLPEDLSMLESTLAQLRHKRNERNARILARLAESGIHLTPGDLGREAGGESVGRPHIARALVRHGHAADTSEAFARYLGKGCPAYVPKENLEPEQGVRLAASLGALVSLAHPMLVRCPAAWLDAFTARLKTCGLGAVEAYHSEHSAQQERDAAALAARHGLLLTGGSDYHGISKPRVHLGRGKGGLRVTTAVLDRLKAARAVEGLARSRNGTDKDRSCDEQGARRNRES